MSAIISLKELDMQIGSKAVVTKEGLVNTGKVGRVVYSMYGVVRLDINGKCVDFSQSSVAPYAEPKKEKITDDKHKLKIQIDLFDIHCSQHPNDKESQKHLQEMKRKYGELSMTDIKESLQENTVFYIVFSQCSMYTHFTHEGNGFAPTKEEAKSRCAELISKLKKESHVKRNFFVSIRNQGPKLVDVQTTHELVAL